MSSEGASLVSPWSDAALAASLFAVDPSGTAGVVLRGLPGPVRDRWLELLRALLPLSAPMRRVPLHVTDGRLLGGLDLAATLVAARPVAERGLLAEADGGVVLLAMAERLTPSVAARVGFVLDRGEVLLERDGLGLRHPSRLGVVALDEGLSEDEAPPSCLRDRLAFHLDLASIAVRDAVDCARDSEQVAAARVRLPEVEASHEVVEALCEAALTLGIASIRAPLLALRVARAAAALAGRHVVSEDDAALAARLVFASRATTLPAAEPPPADDETPENAEPEAETPGSGEDEEPENPSEVTSLTDQVLEGAKAAIPAGLLAQLRLLEGARSASRTSGKAGIRQHSALRGRPAGVRRGEPRAGARLNLVETLRAAAPWQQLRRGQSGQSGQSGTRRPLRVQVHRDDFRVTRFRQRTETTTIFVVDASGSTALHRLAEAKGAVELLLAECYVRRDRVALVAFRGRDAEILLPPTRSLIRAKRSLASLPGGGGTPLSAGIDAAAALAEAIQRRGGTPLTIFLTDGQANIARDGSAGRPKAQEDALDSARRFRTTAPGSLLVDTSPRPQALARQLAGQLDATYLALPHANSAALCAAVRGAGAMANRTAAPVN